jgi:hypothetical protein
MAIGEKCGGLLGLQFVLLIHVGENSDWRLGELLAADAEDADNEECDDRVG